MTKIYRQDFLAQNQNKTIDLDKVRGDSEAQQKLAEQGLSLQQLQRADRNNDGKVDAKEAWKMADDFDRDGTVASLIASVPSPSSEAAPTQAGKTASVLGLMLQDPSLQPADPSTQTQPSQGNDEILFVGMNNETRTSAGAKHEINELRKKGATVHAITNSRLGADQIRVGGQNYDLTTAEGRDGFVQTLGLPAEQSAQIADVLKQTGANARDELAQVAQVWAKAEKGGSIPSRLLISGHHVGSGVWGDGNGKISWENLRGLCEAMPRAAGQVEDLHLSACYSGGRTKHLMYQEMFPNAKTIWAYSGSAPGSGSGATVHQAAWERATRGGGTAIDDTANALKDRHIRKAENLDVAVVGKDIPLSAQSMAQLYELVRSGEGMFENYFQGREEVTNTQQGPLRTYYNQLQALLQQPGLSSLEQIELGARRDQTIRTLFYDSHIRHQFQETYGDGIREGYASLGLPAPNFARLSREDALESIRAIRDHISGLRNTPPAAREMMYVLNGLWNLDSQTIPETWI
ncbi:MAG: hypothetical protein H6727_04865 [Myxococcales bacterium]|nr:hypothetical protein [Myxococcales bacterium]